LITRLIVFEVDLRNKWAMVHNIDFPVFHCP